MKSGNLGLICLVMLVVNAVTNVITWLVSITGSILYWCGFATVSFTAAIILPAGLAGLGAAFVWVCSIGVGASVQTSTRSYGGARLHSLQNGAQYPEWLTTQINRNQVFTSELVQESSE